MNSEWLILAYIKSNEKVHFVLLVKTVLSFWTGLFLFISRFPEIYCARFIFVLYYIILYDVYNIRLKCDVHYNFYS